MDATDDYLNSHNTTCMKYHDLSNGYFNHMNDVGLSSNTDLGGSRLSQSNHQPNGSGNSSESFRVSNGYSNVREDIGIKNKILNQKALGTERNVKLKESTTSKVQPTDDDQTEPRIRDRNALTNGIVNSEVIASINESVNIEGTTHNKGSVKKEDSTNTKGHIIIEGSTHTNESVNIEGSNHANGSISIEGSTQRKGAVTSQCNVQKNGVNSQDSVCSTENSISQHSVSLKNSVYDSLGSNLQKPLSNGKVRPALKTSVPSLQDPAHSLKGFDLHKNIQLHLNLSDADDVMSDGDKNSMAIQSPSYPEKLRADTPIFDKTISISSGQPSAFVSPNKDKHQEKPARKSKTDNKDVSDTDNNQDATKFLQASDTSDLRLVVEGKPLYVSRIVLSIVSPVLKQIFDNRTREASVVEIPLAGKKFDEMLEFLYCVYPDKLKPVTDRNVVQLLALADELQVDTLKSRCEQYLLKELKRGPSSVSADFLIFNMQLADKYNLELIKKQCFEVATRTSTEALENVAGFWDLPHLTTSGIFLQRLKLFEQAARKITKRLNEAETHCSLYHKNERWGDNLCNKCLASVGKVAGAEMCNL